MDFHVRIPDVSELIEGGLNLLLCPLQSLRTYADPALFVGWHRAPG